MERAARRQGLGCGGGAGWGELTGESGGLWGNAHPPARLPLVGCPGRRVRALARFGGRFARFGGRWRGGRALDAGWTGVGGWTGLQHARRAPPVGRQGGGGRG